MVEGRKRSAGGLRGKEAAGKGVQALYSTMADKKQGTETPRRSSLWAFIIYPGDSAPEDWLERLQAFHVPMFISPLHNPDEEGGLKPHRHVFVIFSSLKSQSQVDEISQSVCGTRAFIVEDKAGYAKYLIHLDRTEKQQWTDEQLEADPVIGLCGLDYKSFLLELTDPFEIVREIEDWIDKADVFSLWEVIKYARDNNETWYRILHKRTIAIDLYLKSRLWTLTKQDESLAGYRLQRDAAAAAKQDDPDLIGEDS